MDRGSDKILPDQALSESLEKSHISELCQALPRAHEVQVVLAWGVTGQVHNKLSLLDVFVNVGPEKVQSINETRVWVAETLHEVITASAYDDVQAQAIQAFEALGTSILVSPDRIDEGMTALQSNGRSQIFRWLQNLMVGLSGGGSCRLIRRRAPQCVPAFLLAVSCKTMLSDHEIGNVVWEMVRIGGLLRMTPVSRLQMSQLVGAISGYGDDIVPMRTFQTISAVVQQVAAGNTAMAPAFWKPEPRLIAELFARAFRAVKDVDIDKITLRGVLGGVLIASTLAWLLEESIAISVTDGYIYGSTANKVLIQLSSDPRVDNSWMIQEWRLQKEISCVIVEAEDEASARQSGPDFYPANAARNMIAAQYELDDVQIDLVGKLTQAMVLVAAEVATIKSGTEYGEGSSNSDVALKTLCQGTFLSSISSCSDFYGWEATDDFVAVADEMARSIIDWITAKCPNLGTIGDERSTSMKGHPLVQEPATQLCYIISKVEQWRRTKPSNHASDLHFDKAITEPSLHLAAEYLYSCICSERPSFRSVRSCRPLLIGYNALNIMHLIFAPSLRECIGKYNPPIRFSNLGAINSLSILDLQHHAIESILPAYSQTLDRNDLAVSANGYVGFVASIRRISPVPAECVAISVVPGYIRSGAEHSLFEKLNYEDDRGDPSIDYSKSESFTSPNGAAAGVVARPDAAGVEAIHLVSPLGRELSLRTYLQQSGSRQRTSVNWIGSISAIAAACHVHAPAIPGFAEDQLIKNWQAQEVWTSIAWTAADAMIRHAHGTPIRYVSTTYGDDILRFFLAGRRKGQALFMRQGATPLVQCIVSALESEKAGRTPAGWLILA